MFLLWSGFSGLLLVLVVDSDGSDVLFDTSGRSVVMVISRFLGKDDMATVLGIVDPYLIYLVGGYSV